MYPGQLRQHTVQRLSKLLTHCVILFERVHLQLSKVGPLRCFLPFPHANCQPLLLKLSRVLDYNMLAQQSAPPGHPFLSPSQAPTPSNALAIRDPASSRALVSTAPRSPFDAPPDQWGTLEGDGAFMPLPNEALSEEHLRLLLERARKIEEEATKENHGPNQKRSITPFVLKLSSFLNNGSNSELIRWSEKGDSFIVLDEEDFAKKLIPKMFKHNNYTSFVRQLHIYRFRKRVWLSDNSMRASEKKNKSPSEYAHPYFLRAHPALQWLITKPNKTGGRKRKKQASKDSSGGLEQDSDAEDLMDGPTGQYALLDIQPGRNLGRGEAGPLAETEMDRLRDQLAQVQQEQQQCLALIQELQNNQQKISSAMLIWSSYKML
ncbi:hypothetical protein F5883DRAFT_592609 [Diaporthe sp. PMI_573]|nr:hypothetical protein F5883DRAFT_592609 [Diaporthaceae sp. PMI_573]